MKFSYEDLRLITAMTIRLNAIGAINSETHWTTNVMLSERRGMLYRRPLLAVVGSNPSQASAAKEAFARDTVSGRRVRGWISRAEDKQYNVFYVNVSDDPTPGNRPLKTSEIKDNLEILHEGLDGVARIVAVGKTAAKALKLLKKDFFEMSHPSGRCRKNNDPVAVANQVEGLKRYLLLTEPSNQKP